MKKLLLTALFLSSGCSSLPQFSVPEVKPVEVITVEVPAPMYHPPLPNQIVPMPVEWKVLTPDTMAIYLSDLEKGEAPSQAYYGLTNKGYENLSNNMAEVKRYIRQTLSILQYYREQDQEPRL
jgi:hypothetical protein